MNRGPNDIFTTTQWTGDAMDVDTSFLDAFRRGGSEGLAQVRADEAQQQAEAAPVPEHVVPADPAEGAKPDLERGLEPEPGGAARFGAPGQHGGAGSSRGAVVNTSQQGDAVDATPRTLANQAVATAYMRHPSADEQSTPTSLRLTDHQEAVQNGTAPKVGSREANDNAALPQSGFRLGGVRSQPHIKSIPEAIISVLREQLRTAAVCELGVSDKAAREFSGRLSQGTLVMAFLLAQLDVRFDVDPATGRAAELFRSSNPLLGSVAARLDGLERLEIERTGLLHSLSNELGALRQTAAVVEQAVAYSIADRSENFLRGSHDIRDAPITHTDAVFVRDRMREATKKLTRQERDQDGRPTR